MYIFLFFSGRSTRNRFELGENHKNKLETKKIIIEIGATTLRLAMAWPERKKKKRFGYGGVLGLSKNVQAIKII